MRKLSLVILSGLLVLSGFTQDSDIDSLRQALAHYKKDTNTVNTLLKIAYAYSYYHPDSAYYYGNQGMMLAKDLHFMKGEADGMIMMGDALIKMGNFPAALGLLLRGLKLSEQIRDQYDIEFAYDDLGLLYSDEKDFDKANDYNFKSLYLSKNTHDKKVEIGAMQSIGNTYYEMDKLDSALKYLNDSYKAYIDLNDKTNIHFSQINLGEVYIKMKMDKIALMNYRLALPYITKNKISEALCETTLEMAGIFQRMNEPDSAIYYGKESLAIAQDYFFTSRQLDASIFLGSYYESAKISDSAFKYLKLTIALKDSIFNLENQKTIQNLTFEENIRQEEMATQKKIAYENHIRNLQLLAIGVFIPIFFMSVLFLSRTKVKPRVIEFLGILSLLLFFEFITDLIYPYISDLTNDRPIWEMLILVVIASMLEPMNHKLEYWVKEHLVHKPVPAPIPLTMEDISYDAE